MYQVEEDVSALIRGQDDITTLWLITRRTVVMTRHATLQR